MSRLSEALSSNISRDIITDNHAVIMSEQWEEEPEVTESPVKATLDLSLFDKFDNRGTWGRRGKWISINASGRICVSGEVGKTLPESVRVEFFLNQKGTILVMKQATASTLYCQVG